MASKTLLAALVLAACGTSSSGGTPDAPTQTGTPDAPTQTGTPDAPAQPGTPDAGSTAADVVVTPPGTTDGAPTMMMLDASGGAVTEAKTGASVHFLAGTFAASTQVRVQPVTDTMPDGGDGDGIAVSYGADPTQNYLVSFPYGADEDPDGLVVAVQLADGSWLAYDPIVDTQAMTISTIVPPTLPGAAGKLPQVTLDNPRIFVKLEGTYLVPKSATVRIGQTQDFTPWARVREKDCAVSFDYGDLRAPCKRTVVNKYPFTNDKPGFTRFWAVNDQEGGNATVGTIAPKPSLGATFTAPAQKPSPDVVTVKFESHSTTDATQFVFPHAPVRIIADYMMKVTFYAIGFDVCDWVSADLGDQFSAKLTALPNGGFTLDDISNQKTIIMNEMPTVSPPSSGKDDDQAFDIFTLTDAMFYKQGSVTAVFLEGTSTSSTCTLTPQFGPPTTVPSVTQPTGFLFMFDESMLVDGTFMTIVDIPNSSGVFSVTLTPAP